jgi:hypothetical protein
MAVGATVDAVNVLVASGVGDGAAVVASVTVRVGKVGSSFVTPPPLSTGVDVGVAAGWVCAVGVGTVVNEAAVVNATAARIPAACGSAALLQPARNMATSSHRVMFVIFIRSSCVLSRMLYAGVFRLIDLGVCTEDGQAHAAKAQGRDGPIQLAEFPVLHSVIPFYALKRKESIHRYPLPLLNLPPLSVQNIQPTGQRQNGAG